MHLKLNLINSTNSLKLKINKLIKIIMIIITIIITHRLIKFLNNNLAPFLEVSIDNQNKG